MILGLRGEGQKYPGPLEHNNAPDKTGLDGRRSKLVMTVTLPPAVAAEPMLTPVSVTVTAVLAASAVPPAVMTMEVLPGTPGARVAPLVDRMALGVAVAAKKPVG